MPGEFPSWAITVNVNTAAAYLGCNARDIRKLCADGLLAHVRIAGTLLTFPDALEKWHAENREIPGPEPKTIRRPLPPAPKYLIRDIVYFVEAPTVDLIKIGTSINFGGRLRSLLGQSPVPLVVIGCIAGDVRIERELHARFAEYRAHGEWFRATKPFRAAIDEILANRGVEYVK